MPPPKPKAEVIDSTRKMQKVQSKESSGDEALFADFAANMGAAFGGATDKTGEEAKGATKKAGLGVDEAM